MKTVFTTGEAAKICKVSQQTIIRCFDSGQLKGFRVPGNRFRRIPRDQLYAFMRDNGIPTDALDSGKRKILVVDDDEDLVELIVDQLERDGRFEVRSVNNGFGAGMQIKEFRPDLVVLDVMLPDINGIEVCRLVRSDKTMDDVRIICISGMVEEDKIQQLRDASAALSADSGAAAWALGAAEYHLERTINRIEDAAAWLSQGLAAELTAALKAELSGDASSSDIGWRLPRLVARLSDAQKSD